MTSEKKPPYGTRIAHPDEKAGVEVGGGDKAAAAHSERARKEGDPEHDADDKPADTDDDPELFAERMRTLVKTKTDEIEKPISRKR